VPFNNTIKENKIVSVLEQFGSSLRNGAFIVGRKNTIVSGYNYAKEKVLDEPSNSNNDNNNNL
jgi:hypothetical protein